MAFAGFEAALHVTRGLSAEYFAGEQAAAGAPIRRTISIPSTAAIDRDLDGELPTQFNVRWFGYLAIVRGGVFRFAITSDDGSRMTVDGQVVVENGGIHGPAMQSGQVELGRGSHFVLVEYTQSGGDYAMEWSSARGDGRLSPVPEWALSPSRVDLWRVLLARALDWLQALALVALVLTAAWLVWSADVPRRYPRGASLLFFVALAIAETWPLASNPAGLSRNDNADTVYNEWAMAWVAHQLPRAPLQLFNANIFYPERNTLAFSESIIVQGVMGAPLIGLGASPVLTYNLVLLAGFALTGWVTCFVIARWTKDWMAGLVAGIAVGFNAHTLTRLPHMQAQHAEFLPLALLALDALLREPRLRHAITLAAWFVLQALASVHLMVFTTVALLASALVRPGEWIGANFKKIAPYVGGAAVLAILVVMPTLLPYWQVHQENGFTRPLSDVIFYSASWRDYLMTPGRLHYRWWSEQFSGGTALFPGVVASLLAGLAIWRGVAFRDARARMCLAFGVCGIVLSFGTHIPGYAVLYRFLPILQAIRAVVRFGYLGIVAIGMLGGFGFVELRRRLPQSARATVALLIVTLAIVETFSAPLGFSRFRGIPPIYQQLRSEPNAVIAEIPFPAPRVTAANAAYMLASTAHWRPMLNGYSGFLPASYFENYERLRSFPSRESIATLREQRVTHVVVHLDVVSAEQVRTNAPELHEMVNDGVVAIYRLE